MVIFLAKTAVLLCGVWDTIWLVGWTSLKSNLLAFSKIFLIMRQTQMIQEFVLIVLSMKLVNVKQFRLSVKMNNVVCLAVKSLKLTLIMKTRQKTWSQLTHQLMETGDMEVICLLGNFCCFRLALIGNALISNNMSGVVGRSKCGWTKYLLPHLLIDL